MKTKLWLVAATVFGFGLGACGDDGGGGPAVTFEDVLAEGTAATCSQFVRCGLAADQDTCEAAFRATGPSATLMADVGSGKVTFDGDAARVCFNAIADAACEVTAVAYRARPVECLNIYQGSVAEGGACTIDEECVSQKCAAPSCDMACCPGTCLGDAAPGLAKAGEACDPGGCDDASYCDKVEHVCVAVKGANASCESYLECADGLYCLLSGVCGSLPSDGETCDSDGCQLTDEYCNTTTHVCTKVGTEDAACNNDSECSALYDCDATKHCTAGLVANAPCRRIDRCASGLRCDIATGDDTGFCHPLHNAGEACATDDDCGYKCDLDAGSCYADAACP